MGPAVQMLTGAPYFETIHNSMSIEKLWNYLGEKLAANWVVTCGSHYSPGGDSTYNAIGVANSHAYTVLGTDKLSNGQMLVKVRNPWGGYNSGYGSSEKFQGDWSDNSNLWTDEFRAEVDYVNKKNGEWFISAEDYHESM